jgi:hypothetical protein
VFSDQLISIMTCCWQTSWLVLACYCCQQQPASDSVRHEASLARSKANSNTLEVVFWNSTAAPWLTALLLLLLVLPLSIFMPCCSQNYGPADPSSIAAESKEEEAVRKAEYSLYQPKPAKKAIRRGGLKHAHGTQHLRLKSHAWHS